jgi:hypothetical protein
MTYPPLRGVRPRYPTPDHVPMTYVSQVCYESSTGFTVHDLPITKDRCRRGRFPTSFLVQNFLI